MNIALNHLIIRSNAEENAAKIQLEIEESNRKVANLQGKVSGHRRLMTYLADKFHFSQHALEYNGEQPEALPDMEDIEFGALVVSIQDLRTRPEWHEVESEIAHATEEIKTHLLISAEKTRDLDVAQGTYQGMTMYRDFFRSVETEHQRRDEKAKKDREQPGLF